MKHVGRRAMERLREQYAEEPNEDDTPLTEEQVSAEIEALRRKLYPAGGRRAQ